MRANRERARLPDGDGIDRSATARRALPPSSRKRARLPGGDGVDRSAAARRPLLPRRRLHLGEEP